MYRKLGVYFLIGVTVPVLLFVLTMGSTFDSLLADVGRAIFLVTCPGYILSVLLFDLEASYWFDVTIGSILNGVVYVGIVALVTRLPRDPVWFRPIAIFSGAIVWFGGLFLVS
jgi:hypothetical protein